MLVMFKNSLDSKFYLKTFFHSFLLSFLAGNVNAGGFMACGRFVTHVTGFATLFGVDLARGDWQAGIGIMSVPLYFLVGSMISAYLIDKRIHEGRRAAYPVVMGLITACLLLAAFGGHFSLFGIFGQGIDLRKDYILLALLCGASGLQNAAVTTFSGAVVRTTHLTGITTDLGIGIVRAVFSAPTKKDYCREVRANWLRAITVLSFMFGSVVGAFLFLTYNYLGFLLPALIAFYAMIVTQFAGDDIPMPSGSVDSPEI